MSFILDALKKSENERQRQHGPALADVPLSRRRNTHPWWMIGVGGLLVVNLAILLFVLLRHDTSSTMAAPSNDGVPPVAVPRPQPVAPQRSVAKMPPIANITNTSASVPTGVRPLADEANPPQIEYEPVPATAVPEGPALVRSLRDAKVASASNDNEMVPTINDVGGPGAAGVPELHLDIHVYSKQPAERFVFINTHKYVESQATAEGPIVDRITPDGVILNFRGKRFLLPRQ